MNELRKSFSILLRKISLIETRHTRSYIYAEWREGRLPNPRAFKACVLDKNGLVALAILRLQLDTVLRLYALHWVSDPQAFAKEVFEGKQIDRIKAADGQLMKDKYLIEKLAPKNPWILDVYRNTSGLIHFSDRHIRASIRAKHDTGHNYEIFIGPTNPLHEYKDFDELIAAFFHATAMIQVAIEYWFENIERRNGPQ